MISTTHVPYFSTNSKHVSERGVEAGEGETEAETEPNPSRKSLLTAAGVWTGLEISQSL